MMVALLVAFVFLAYIVLITVCAVLMGGRDDDITDLEFEMVTRGSLEASDGSSAGG